MFLHLFTMKWWDQMPWSSFSECWALSQLFHSLTYIKRLFSSSFCHKGGVIGISEVVVISPGNLDSSLCFIQPIISHDHNHDGVITHLEPDILECEVKWTLGSITMDKASGGDGIPVELFQILKDDALKVLHSICQQIWKNQQWPQDWKMSVFIQSQRKAMPKNVQTTTQLHSFHMLAR